jgi:hypothetical protein
VAQKKSTTRRKPQINFQVNDSFKLLYEEAKAGGHWVTRLCAAGLLLMIEDGRARQHALNRLRDWEAEYDRASPAQIREFVQDAAHAMQVGARGARPARATRRARRAAARAPAE